MTSTPKIGQTITYRALDGEHRRVTVVALDTEDGREVFDGRLIAPTNDGLAVGETVWGYVADIIA